MIVYKTQDWLHAIWYFHTDSTARSLFKRLFFVALYVTAITVIELNFFNFRLTNTPAAFFQAMGILLSLLLLFRTNTAYDRFYEGRRVWGALVNNTRNLAVMVNTMLPPEDRQNRLFFAKTISNFPFALKNHLRGANIPGELEIVEGQDNHLPHFVEHVPMAVVNQIRQRVELLGQQKILSDAQLINLNPVILSFLDISGMCERIKSTPIPFSYSFFIKLFITMYVMVLPFTILQEYGYMTIPAVLLTSYVLVGLEMIGEEIEEPFGLNRNDLPLTQLSMNMRINVHDALGVHVPHGEKVEARKAYVVVS